jgi:hypothetical protein
MTVMENAGRMKPLNKLSPIERAEFLFELFPDEMPGLVEFSKELTQSIIDHPEKMKASPNLLHSTPFWFELVNKASRKFETFGTRLATTSTLFSHELFGKYEHIYASYCLHQFMLSENCTNRKFRDTMMLLFSNETMSRNESMRAASFFLYSEMWD